MEPEHTTFSEENKKELRLKTVSDDERLTRYCEALLADPQITMLHDLRMQRSLEVTKVYVPLRLFQDRQLKYDMPLSDEASMKASEEEPDFWIEEERQRREQHGEVIFDPETALHTLAHCVIAGGPGSGKSTLLRYLAIVTAQRSIAGMSSLLPIYVDLQSLACSGLQDLLDYVSTNWEVEYGFPKQETRFPLENYLDKGKALILLDALDGTMVGERFESAEQSYEVVSEAILKLAIDYPKATIVVTTRKSSSSQHKPLAGFTTLDLMDFRFEDMKQLAQNWYEAIPDLLAVEEYADFITCLQIHPHLRNLAANPLLLTLMLTVYEDQWDIPERRSDLYRMSIERLLAKKEVRFGTNGETIKLEQKIQLLKALAWHYHRKGQRYFSEHDLLQVMLGILPNTDIPVELTNDMVQELISEQDVLEKLAVGWYRFTHLTLQEYFTAEYINDNQKDEELLRFRIDPWWEEVLLLYLGITPDASSFMQQIYSEYGGMREDIFSTNVLLAGRCLTAHPKLSDSSLQAQAIERLFELVMSAKYSMLRQEAIKVVCGIGEVETNRKLVSLLSDKRLHAFIHRSVTGALGTLGESSIADDLVKLLTDEQLNVNLRRSIVDALSTLGEPSVANKLVSLLTDTQLDPDLRWSMISAIGRLGEPSVASELVQLLPDERLDIELRKSIAEVLATLGESSVANDMVLLLVDERLNIELRSSIAHALGKLGEPSVAADMVLLLADEQLNTELRRTIADALGNLGDPTITASVMVEMLADEQQDVFVRRRITGALGLLGEPSVADDLVQLLANEQLNTELRESIAEALGTLGEPSVIGDLVQMLTDEQQDISVRRAIAIALVTLGEPKVAAKVMVQLLADGQVEVSMRCSIAEALGILGEPSVASDLVQLLANDELDLHVRWSIANTLGKLGERSVAANLSKLLTDTNLDAHLQWSIADALGMLGKRLVAAKVMVQLLSDERLGVFMRRKIAKALSKLGESRVAAELTQLLTDKRLHEFVRTSIAEALGNLGEPLVTTDLVQLLSDTQLEVDLRRSIANSLAAYAHDLSTVSGLVKSLPEKEISESVYRALWTVSRRARVWIFPVDFTAQSGLTPVHNAYEMVPWE
jgi:HEAT repeat protein